MDKKLNLKKGNPVLTVEELNEVLQSIPKPIVLPSPLPIYHVGSEKDRSITIMTEQGAEYCLASQP